MTLIGLSFSCSDVRLKGLERDFPSLGRVTSKICVSPGGEKVVQNVIFVIDQSGSNGPHTSSGVAHPGNDPAKAFRHGSMEPFYNYHKSNPNFRWGFIYFSGQVVDAYIKDGGEPALTPEGNSAGMQTALANFMGNPDVSGSLGTNYTDALAKVERLLLNDLAAREQMNNKGEVHDIYDVFFVSDGLPINSLGETPISGPGDSRIRLITDLIGKKSGDIHLHTAFYQTAPFQNPTTARTGLQLMANAGKGSFIDVSAGEQLDFQSLLGGFKAKPITVKNDRLHVYNLNSGFCMDGSVDVDSDSDGLCDKDEVSFNSIYKADLDRFFQGGRFDPTQRHSLHKNYSDGFVWKYGLFGGRQGLKDCAIETKDEDFDLLNACEEALLLNLSPNGPTDHWTNRMESQYGKTTYDLNYDSDGDGVLDFQEFFQFLSLPSAEINPTDFQNLYERYDQNTEVKDLFLKHRHPLNPFESRGDYDIQFDFAGYNDKDYPCYDVRVADIDYRANKGYKGEKGKGTAYNIPYLKHEPNENVIMLYYIATDFEDPHGTGTLYYHHYNLEMTTKEITLQQSDFKLFKSYER
ncbi:MAG: hypothetical protein H6624_07210 [Bdellovibrionaceae bacterium]|nr:hypothetical protein [Bdellovibrionales bacterium]MCB9084116.1 hypothetical protein [Pseudobdellovibrionaceae bacterium]